MLAGTFLKNLVRVFSDRRLDDLLVSTPLLSTVIVQLLRRLSADLSIRVHLGIFVGVTNS